MENELNALEQNNTWTLQSLLDGKTTVGCMWLFKLKYLANGLLEKYKARLVALENTQTHGLDYFETFTTMAKMTSVRILIAIVSHNSWRLTQMD